MSNKEKLVKRFDRLCDLIQNGELHESDYKGGMSRDARSIGGVLNELKVIQQALDIVERLEDDDLEEINKILK